MPLPRPTAFTPRALARRALARPCIAGAAKRRITTSASDSDSRIQLTVDGPKATLTLNNARVANALDVDVQHSLLGHLAALHDRTDIRAVVLTGAGKYFCSGMNLGSKGESLAGNNQDQHDRLKRLFEGISNLNKPVIAVINGPCYGGGNGLAMVCDIRIASHPGVTFNLSEVTIGVAPALISKYLVREWGAAKAREAMLTARAIPAAELLTVGGVHHVAEDAAAAHAYADALVARFVGNAPGAMAAVKQLTNTMATEAEGEQDAAIARMFLDMMRPSLEAKYGIDMFRAKQKADWSSLYARQ